MIEEEDALPVAQTVGSCPVSGPRVGLGQNWQQLLLNLKVLFICKKISYCFPI